MPESLAAGISFPGSTAPVFELFGDSGENSCISNLEL
jgi:hypothetical protein